MADQSPKPDKKSSTEKSELKRDRREVNLGISFGLLLSLFGWGVFIINPSMETKGTTGTIEDILTILLILALGFLLATTYAFNGIQAAGIVVVSASTILMVFTDLYYEYAEKSFSQPLTRLDAFYLALGNLTTAGTGNIYPVTERGRVFVSIQYGADLLLLIGLISILTFRVSRRK